MNTTSNPNPNQQQSVAWHVRYPGAQPDRVLVEPARSKCPDDLHIVGIGPREFIHGRWGKKLYHTRDEALAATIAAQEVKVRNLEHALAWNREHHASLRAMMTAPGQQHPHESASPDNTTVETTSPTDEQ